MPRATPIKTSFNSGELSVLLEGRVDKEVVYGASARTMHNFIATPQGPMIRRSGTYMMTTNAFEDHRSGLVPWYFSDQQAFMLEFCNGRMRFHNEQGILTFTPVDVIDVYTLSPFKVSVAEPVTVTVGDQVVLNGFPNDALVNGVTANVTAINSLGGGVSTISLDIPYIGATGVLAGATISRIYHIAVPYTGNDVRNIQGIQDVDIMYMFCEGYKVQKLSRHDVYDWRIKDVEFEDGPFASVDPDCPVLTPDDAGIATAIHTTYISSTGTASASTEDAGSAWQAFDRDRDTYWRSATVQEGTLNYHFVAPIVIQGYTIYIARGGITSGGGYTPKDRAPGTWSFEASDDGGTTWVVLDEKFDYTLYTNYRSFYVDTKNKRAYQDYRLVVSSTVAGVVAKVFVGELVMRERGDRFINFVADAITGINRGQGFLATDVGRLMRIYQSDGYWRSLIITEVTDTKHVKAKLQGEPLMDTSGIRQWRLGYFSDTTGWPTCGAWFNDRLVVGGVREFPTLVAMSKPGDGFYEIFSPSDPSGQVNDDSGVAALVKTRDASLVQWLQADAKVLLVGTSGAEYSIGPNTDNDPFSARNIRAAPSTRRGSSDTLPVTVDRQVLFINALKRTVYEHSYRLDVDGYKSPSMSIMASHIGIDSFLQMTHCAEPHSIVWFRQLSEVVAGLTYSRDDNVIGWHTHDFAGGKVETVASMPSLTDRQHTLWMIVRRTINGQTRRFIERLTRFWDFGMDLNTDAHFVDCGLRGIFEPATDTVYVPWLEGKSVAGLVDGIPFGVYDEIVVTNGKAVLPQAGANIVIGLPYTSHAETNRPEAGSAEGTAQGKVKRQNQVVTFVWDTFGGEVGVRVSDYGAVEYTDIEYDEINREGDVLNTPVLKTGMIKTAPAQTYGRDGTLHFRQTQPLPFNVISHMPWLTTQDGG